MPSPTVSTVPTSRSFWVDDRGHYIVDDSGTAWFYVTIIDISDKVNSQRQLERAEERVDMLTMLSRDVMFVSIARTNLVSSSVISRRASDVLLSRATSSCASAATRIAT